ncbi:MAG: hypothetical protein WA184_09275 [Stellaceae bacterium]
MLIAAPAVTASILTSFAPEENCAASEIAAIDEMTACAGCPTGKTTFRGNNQVPWSIPGACGPPQAIFPPFRFD